MHLYFFSPTCGPCRRISPKVDAAIAAGKPIRKIDVSTEEGRFVSGLFGITAVPAYVQYGQLGILTGNDVAKEFE